jgi:hypothetical protein
MQELSCQMCRRLRRFGQKKVDRQGVQLGSGMIQMIVDPNRNKMIGSVTWYDSDSKQIEHSKVEWTLL